MLQVTSWFVFLQTSLLLYMFIFVLPALRGLNSLEKHMPSFERNPSFSGRDELFEIHIVNELSVLVAYITMSMSQKCYPLVNEHNDGTSPFWMVKSTITGWWFGSCLFSIQSGIVNDIQFQPTFILFRGVGTPPTSPILVAPLIFGQAHAVICTRLGVTLSLCGFLFLHRLPMGNPLLWLYCIGDKWSVWGTHYIYIYLYLFPN